MPRTTRLVAPYRIPARGATSATREADLDERTLAQLTAHGQAPTPRWRAWLRLPARCACGLRWSQCPDAIEARLIAHRNGA